MSFNLRAPNEITPGDIIGLRKNFIALVVSVEHITEPTTTFTDIVTFEQGELKHRRVARYGAYCRIYIECDGK